MGCRQNDVTWGEIIGALALIVFMFLVTGLIFHGVRRMFL